MDDSERDELLGRLDEKTDYLVGAQKDHEKRMRDLEKSRSLAAGAIAFILAFKALTMKTVASILGGP